MKCPYCRFDDDAVLDSRPMQEGTAIKRRRECKHCGRRFTTFETIEEMQLIVVKKPGPDGESRREPFDRAKLLRSIRVACQKRSISEETLQGIVDDIERTLTNRLEKEVSSTDVGELVMDHLHGLDQVAYVRFASVYQAFEDATQFRDIVNMLRKQRTRKKDAGAVSE
ncbi:MAG: transcriptional regulator NrdR [Capsulimonas sp.]|jgi:transcriptional repressor NrdR|uniref:transcriptional regulator NrdR n=1 Tax=Capsulimonas sp. TaxID=2494211 RepID=UPI0032671AC7